MVEVRPATIADVPFLDALQKRHRHFVAFLPHKALETYIDHKLVIIALENGEPAAYLLGVGATAKNPHVAAIYQAVVQYDARRRAVGSALVESFIDRLPSPAAVVRLWCAQDIDANLFWQSQGFQSVAYSEGGKTRGRVHILWQRPLASVPASQLPLLPILRTGGLMNRTVPVFPMVPGQTYSDVTLSRSPEIAVAVPNLPVPGRVELTLPDFPSKVARFAVARAVHVICGGRVRTKRQAS